MAIISPASSYTMSGKIGIDYFSFVIVQMFNQNAGGLLV
jgi:hypothetical protein